MPSSRYTPDRILEPVRCITPADLCPFFTGAVPPHNGAGDGEAHPKQTHHHRNDFARPAKDGACVYGFEGAAYPLAKVAVFVQIGLYHLSFVLINKQLIAGSIVRCIGC